MLPSAVGLTDVVAFLRRALAAEETDPGRVGGWRHYSVGAAKLSEHVSSMLRNALFGLQYNGRSGTGFLAQLFSLAPLLA